MHAAVGNRVANDSSEPAAFFAFVLCFLTKIIAANGRFYADSSFLFIYLFWVFLANDCYFCL